MASLTQTSIGPSSSSAWVAAASTACASATSTSIGSARRPRCSMSRAAASSPCLPRASRATSKPRSASARAVARPSVDGQQTDEPRHADRPANLWKPVDADCDAGARGRFGDDAHGFFTPSFLRMLPSTATQLGRAAADTAAEKVHVAVRRLRT
jgi:hypothetical protein